MGIIVEADDLIGEMIYIPNLNEKIYVLREGDEAVIIVDNDPPYPYLGKMKLINYQYWLRVDRGAAEALLRGADLMAPGVESYNEFPSNHLVMIKYVDTEIAVGLSLMDYSELESIKKGKVVKILHYKGDRIWRYLSSLKLEK